MPYSGMCEYDIHLHSNVVTYENPVARNSASALTVSSSGNSTCRTSSHRRLPQWTRRTRPRDGPAQLLMSYFEDASGVQSLSTPKHILLALKDTTPSEEPTTYKQAMKSPAKAQWLEAMMLELAAHEANGSFEPATLPSDATPLGMRWVFKIKYNDLAIEAARRVAGYKARLVIQVHTEIQGVQYEESYSPFIAK
ncbi:hypothetical protein AaE_013361 [Aphanomyces astaci]|uniref:Reverse transcriptase Ty1/copia-type domain-containing protein n=1 Tax=Aphanomyces astaci TaxID=112090 RepID=A0A6A4Z7L1_APHAT|nr:hypothetical protein AaE_013361 [Aphanomyces astaci]